ncbi:phosphomethylpyrimidine kinase/thiamin-phosphate pyrophosphorylase [Legionella adelaidensis]|uniref:Thiamine-phosphate synthase n=1 Tax=Legionella adelaidensis TaxID=45056 RepID=A0A0W0R0U7_9GAMM|nr:thiamine phosphate synthase [Legionella adelaidensis]KTC64716.1 phosphomethylpyrimidine kinase/thiamin-phosphate pyrophosphorylase [Legionella adelaidensis]
MHTSTLKLCLVTDPHRLLFDNNYFSFIHNAIKGGISSVQLRVKSFQGMDLVDRAKQLQALLYKFAIPLIINDDVTLAKDLDAEGVHLGQSDLSPEVARQILGPDKIIGLSIETFEQLEKANKLDCIDYVAASAIFPSKTKSDCKTIWGLKGLKNFTRQSKHPVVAIGGINSSNIHDVIAQGVDGVAVVSAIHDHFHPEQAASQLIQAINQG